MVFLPKAKSKSFLALLLFLFLTLSTAPPTLAADTLYFLHTDHLGSTRVVTDKTGTVVAKYDYYPYGAINYQQLTTSSPPTERLYTSQISDESTDLYFYNARYYNPAIGNFISADTVQGPDRYSYTTNNPINNTDPSGNHVPLDAGFSGSLPQPKPPDPISPKEVAVSTGGVATLAYGVAKLVDLFRSVTANDVKYAEDLAMLLNDLSEMYGPAMKVQFSLPPGLPKGAAAAYDYTEGIRTFYLPKLNTFFWSHECGHCINDHIADIKDYWMRPGLTRAAEIEANQMAIEFNKAIGNKVSARNAQFFKRGEQSWIYPAVKGFSYWLQSVGSETLFDPIILPLPRILFDPQFHFQQHYPQPQTVL